ncbi:MAG: hypothetical protein JW820_06090 [Spirochaetales bacterium]|nr:hypothetical protein [Spirochaetales bacterium]
MIVCITAGCVDLPVSAILQMSTGIVMLYLKRLGEGARLYGILPSLAFGAAILGGVMRLVMRVTPMGVPPAVLVNTIKGSLIGEMSSSVLIFIVAAIAGIMSVGYIGFADQIPYVDRDHIKTGYAFADWVATEMGGKGNVIVIMGYRAPGIRTWTA